MPKRTGPRILTLDIETAPLEAYSWGIWEVNVALNQVKHDWSILSFAAKWLDSPKIIYHGTGGRGKDKVRDDKVLMGKLWALLNEADIVVAQNGAAFDLRRINARLVTHGYKPYSPIRVIDTLLVAKKAFAFTSNKLEWMTKNLTTAKKLTHAKFSGFDLWLECLADNRSAWAEMKRYNIADVVATEELFLKLRPWIQGHPNVAAYQQMESVACPKCGSPDVQKRGTVVTQTGEYHRFQCQACGGWSRGRQTVNTAMKRKGLLAN